MINKGQGYTPLGDLTAFASSFNAQAAQIMGILSKVSTVTLVRVEGVDADAKTVDILPLVNMVDGSGNPFPYQIIYGKPYWQPQSGNSAVELSPTKGDIGLAIFADRDISNVIATKQQSNPGSRRMFDMSDGLYLGAFPGLNQAITQFIKFDPSSGITITSPIAVAVNAPNVIVNAAGSASVVSPEINLGDGGAMHAMLNSLFSTWAQGHIHDVVGGGTTTVPTTSPASNTQTTIVQAQ
jgi:hypothetical protein